MSDMRLFAQITKVDEAKRLVFGRAVQEVPDRADEIFDYASSKQHFVDWSKSFDTDTGGKSLGNLRAMHGKVAAGKLTAIDFNDTAKAIDITAKVVDDSEWAKVIEGVYTGFSIGGSYVGDKTTEKIGDRTIKRYTAQPAEISLVDSPCIPTAKFFDIVKADGALEKKAFKPPEFEVVGTDEQVAEFAEAMKANGLGMTDIIKLIGVDSMLVTADDLKKREFSTEARDKAAESGAALPDGSFPIKTVGDLKNAVQAYGRAKDKEKAKAHIIARAKALGDTSDLPDDWKGGDKAAPTDIEKADDKKKKEKPGDKADDEENDNDEDDTAKVLQVFAKAGKLAKRLADPELLLVDLMKIADAELTEDERKGLKTPEAVKAAIVAKAGRFTAAHGDMVQAIHDHAASMGADCAADKAHKGNLEKAASAELKDALERIKKLEAQPVPYVTLRAVAKQVEKEAPAPTAFADTPEFPSLEKSDYIYNGDGTIDYASSYLQKRYKLAAVAAK
jgi:hypothetical protein